MIPDHENTLPFHQPVIVTASVSSLMSFFDIVLAAHHATGFSCMAVVTGNAGLGKTIAIHYYLDSLTLRLTMGLPNCVAIKVAPRSTPKGIVNQLLSQIRGVPTNRTLVDLESATVDAVRRMDLDAIIVDEADWLSIEGFEMLRHVHDRSGVPVVLIGLPSIWRVIKTQEKFLSRIGMQMNFLPPTQQEWYQTILPAIQMPYWSYRHPEDAELGAYLWKQVGPSLRRLRVLLQCAGQFVDTQETRNMTIEHFQRHESLLRIPGT